MCDWSSKGCPKSCINDCTFKSEYSHEFKNTPYTNYREYFEVPVPCSRYVFPQQLYEHANQLIPPSLSRYSSTYRDDYKPCERMKPKPQTPSVIFHSRPDHQLVDIDVKHFGYEKYLDIYATTNTLNHRPFSPRESNRDAITVWDWLRIPKTRGHTVPLDIPIPKQDLANTAKVNRPGTKDFVPNAGLLSEYRDEFTHKSICM